VTEAEACRLQGVCFETLRVGKLAEKRQELLAVDCVFIDEGQFIPDLAEVVAELVAAGKLVYVSALEIDVNRNYWEPVMELRQRVPGVRVKRLKADCHMCLTPNCAEVNYRTSSHEGRFHIGGSEAYIAVCPGCDAVRNRADT